MSCNAKSMISSVGLTPTVFATNDMHLVEGCLVSQLLLLFFGGQCGIGTTLSLLSFSPAGTAGTGSQASDHSFECTNRRTKWLLGST